MAQSPEDIKWLYGKLKSKGYDIGNEDEFTASLGNEDDRKWYYDKAVGMGLKLGSMEDFDSLYAPRVVKPQSPASAEMNGGKSLTGAAGPEQGADATESSDQGVQQPSWRPTEQEKIRGSYGLQEMLDDFNVKSRARVEQSRRMAERMTPEGRESLKSGEVAARIAGAPTRVAGLAPRAIAPMAEAGGAPYDKPAARDIETDASRAPIVQSGQSPVPYGVKYVDGKPVTEWLMPDGELTTDLREADMAESDARGARLRHEFEGRMKRNGLDVAKQEDVEKQRRKDDFEVEQSRMKRRLQEEERGQIKWDADEPMRRAIENARLDEDEERLKHFESARTMPMSMAGAAAGNVGAALDTKLKGYGAYDKIVDKAVENLPKEYKDAYTRYYDKYLAEHPEELKGKDKQEAIKDLFRAKAYDFLYRSALKRNAPKDELDFFLKQVGDNSVGAIARAIALPGEENIVADQVMGEYGKDHRLAQVGGTVLGMAIDPVAWISGGFGSLAGKGALSLGGRYLTGVGSKVGARLFGSSLTGRIIVGSAGAAGNLATYEGLKEAENQLKHGGHINPETGENEGYSAGEMLKATGHGALMGSVIGPLSPVIGNVADKAVKATTPIAGKLALRGGEIATSTLAEGTIFSVPEWINGDGDAFDVWTDNMAMMLGFKGQHVIKSVPRVIASLRPVKPVDGKPLTQAERNHNRMDFEERLRRNLDASQSDVSFSADEREELRRAGYGELADLFIRKKEQEAPLPPEGGMADGAIKLRIERVEAEEVGKRKEFDGYSAMERLMQDSGVSQAVRAKAYYILTPGRMLPMGTVAGYKSIKEEDGRVTINAVTADGEVVTSRKFANEKSAQQEIDNIMRQAELNSVDVGERFAEAVADDMVLSAAVNEVSPGADPEAVKRIYRAVKAGNKDVTKEQVQLAEFIDDAISRNKDMADAHRPEAIRQAIKEETGIDTDATLRKSPARRTEAEQEAVKTYLERLFPEEARERAEEPTPEQKEAQGLYEEGKLLYGRFEEGDPTAQAGIDEIAMRMQEAYQSVEDAFGADAEYYMFHLNENPWGLLNDPELTVDQQDAVLYYINSKAALDGVMDASNEAGERKRNEVRQAVEKRTHKDNGVIIPATMKVDDRQVYVVKGDVVMYPDGTGVDVHNSSESIVVMDAQSGEYEFTSPDQIMSVGESIDPEVELQTAYESIDRDQQELFTVLDGQEATEAEASAQEQITERGNAMAPDVTEESRGTEEASAEEADNNDVQNIIPTSVDELKVPENGNIEDENIPLNADNEAVASQGETPVAMTTGENGQQTALSRIPLNEQGEPMFEAVDKETAWDGLVEAVGTEADAVDIAMAQVQQATADLEALKKKPPTPKAPKLKGSPMAMAQAKREAAEKYQSDLAEYNQQVADTQARLDAWNGIVSVYTSRNAELRRQQEEARRQRDAEAHDAAVARFEEEQRLKAEREAEQERIGTNAVNPKIKEKWDSAEKIEGNPDAITLPDGSAIRGRYVLTEAGAASASHDVNNAFEPTEGFPIDENGQSVNDRDYLRDKDAQRIVQQMADAYDNRALQTPVIVSQDGVVLSGNNRTMSGDLAARQGTDKAYVDYLREFGQKYGFTPEQVTGMKNPRLVFVPDEALPYDATTFSRFNAQEMKSQSKPEAAVKLGKIVPDNVFNNIVSDISRYDRLSDYYADEKAVAHALGALMQAGVINDKQMPEMRTGTALSAAGKELIENTLIGKVFQTSPDAVRQIISTPTVRQSIVMGLNEIANNRTLASQGYDLSEELSKAVDLVTRAKAAMPDVYTDGMPVSPFGRMQGLFDDEYGDSSVTDATTLLLADLLNSGRPSDLRKVLTSYNNEAFQAAGGQADIFTGEIPSKETILKDVNEHFRNATPREQQALVDAAIAERKRRAEAEAEQRGRDQASEQVENADERGAVAPVATVEPTEAQLAAGNYKKEHRRIDGYNISIENPKGSVRRGKDADGKEWQTEMHNDYGYIRGTEGVDGDHIDVFLSDTPEEGDVFVIDQRNADGSFDEHKVMYGFPTEEAAREAYLSNYEPGWTGLGAITQVSKEEFKKWVQSSKRKTKPFADYKNIKTEVSASSQGSVADYKSVKAVASEKRLSEKEASDLIARMESNAEVAPNTDLTPENWIEQFGEDGKVETPVGTVKMGENQFIKLFSRKRAEYFGMIKPTLTNPDVVLEEEDPKDGAERDSKYLFIKTFLKSDGSRIVHFESVTVRKDGMEVSISSHEINQTAIKNKMQNDKILHLNEKLSPDSEMRLTRTPNETEGPDLVPTSDNVNSEGKDNALSANSQISEVINDDASIAPGDKPVVESTVTESEDIFQEAARIAEAAREKRRAEVGGRSDEVSGAQKGLRRIEDFGEKILGARKDALNEFSKSVDEITEQALIELPLSKAFKRPNLKKLTDEGLISDAEALQAEAIMLAYIYSEKKPVLTRYTSSRREIAEWAKRTHGGMRMLADLLSGDGDRSTRAMSEHASRQAESLKEAQMHLERMKEWNPDREFKDLTELPDQVEIMYRVLKDLGYRPGEKIDLPLSRIDMDRTYQKYVVNRAGKQGSLWFKRYYDNIEDAINAVVTAAKLARGDKDVELPAEVIGVRGTGVPHRMATGEYRVGWMGRGVTINERIFADETEAKAFAEEKNGICRPVEKLTGDYDGYAVFVTNPLTGNRHQIKDGFASRAEAEMYIEGERQKVNNLSLEAIYEEMGKKAKVREHFYVSVDWDRDRGRATYSVMTDDKNTPWPVIKRFEKREDAKKWLDENINRLENERAEAIKRRKEIVYFDDSAGKRVGPDYRQGKNADAQMYEDAFGFRGVQFGNWTNDADRQAALNQAYDAFMDMARVLGVSPRAMSLDGELGLAFGARGSGRARAHYEPTQVVINLTKTMGAGSLAHEWWHALDNYLSRNGGVAMGYASHRNGMNGMAPEVKGAIESLMNKIDSSEYKQRSVAQGDYWGRGTEVMARLFAEWVNFKLEKLGEECPFLSRGVVPSIVNMIQRINYTKYKESETMRSELTNQQPTIMVFDEFKDDPRSLYGHPYPTRREVEDFSADMNALFDALSSRESESGSMAHERGVRYGRKRQSDGLMGNLFDVPDAQPDVKAEAINGKLDEYCLDLADFIRMDEGEELIEAEERMAEKRDRMLKDLEAYYREEGHTEADAKLLARDLLSQVQSEVTIRINESIGNSRSVNNDAKASEPTAGHGIEGVSTGDGTEKAEDERDKKGAYVTAGGDKIEYENEGGLRPLDEGEFCLVERKFSLDRNFEFTGSERIESADDVAYIFRQLENAAIENSFVLFVKDGKPIVVHIGMGNTIGTVVDNSAVRGAYDALNGAEAIYFVHNHPSGNLRCSAPDVKSLRTLSDMFPGKVQDGIIIDTRSGKYLTFDTDGTGEVQNRPGSIAGEEVPVAVNKFDVTDYGKDFDPEKLNSIRNSEDAASIISTLRLGSRGKVGLLVMNNQNQVIGNLYLPYVDLKESKQIGEIAVGTAIRYGVNKVLIYGNYDNRRSDLRSVAEVIKERSGGTVSILDSVSVTNGLRGHESARDEGLMEPTVAYGSDDESRGLERKIIGLERFDNEMRDALRQYLREYSSATITVIGDIEDVARVDLPDDVKEGLIEGLKDEDVMASYCKYDKKIYIFAERLTSAPELRKALIHENIHAIVDKAGDGMRTRLSSFVEDLLANDTDTGLFRRVFERIKEEYPSDKWQEELAAYLIPWLLRQPVAMERMNQSLKKESVKFIDELINGQQALQTLEHSNKLGYSQNVGRVRRGVGRRGEVRWQGREVGQSRRGTEQGGLGNSPEWGEDAGEDADVEAKFRDGENAGERLRAIRALKPIEVTPNSMSRAELFSEYRSLPTVNKNGEEIRFLRGMFGKIYRPGGLFAQAVPVLGEILEHSVLAYSEADSHGVTVRPDGTSHKAHPNVDTFDNYVGKMSLEGKEYYVRLTVQNTKDSTTGVHSCFVSNVDLYEKTASEGTGTTIYARPNQTESGDQSADGLTAPNFPSGERRSDGIVDAKLRQFFERASGEALELDKRDRIAELSNKLNTPIRIIDDVDAPGDKPLSGRKRRAKGWWDSQTGEVVVVLPNNVNVADVDNTVVHEVVGHKGLRELIGAERFDDFLGEVYSHASNPIRKTIDKMTDDMVNAEADRLRVRKSVAHERAGEDVNSHYYTDMAEARTEAEKKREQFRKEATEEYMADLGGRIGSEGFEKMSRDELTLWGKIKAKVQQFLDKFLQGLKIAKSIRLGDKDLSYILYKSWRNMRDESRTPDQKGGVFAEAEDIVMRRKTGWDAELDARVREDVELNQANYRFNSQLNRYINGEMATQEYIYAGKPHGAMKLFLSEVPIVVRQRVLRKASTTKHNVELSQLEDLPGKLAEPIFVFQRDEKSLGVLTELRDRDGKNVCVAIELNRSMQSGSEVLEVNDIRSLHGRDVSNIVLPIVHNNTLRYADKEKGLEWLHSVKSKSQANAIQDLNIPSLEWLSSASSNYQQEIAPQDLESATKVVENFENPKYDEGAVIRFRDPGLGLEETITRMKAEAMQANAGNLQAKREAMRAIGGNLNHLRQAMARQREYDITTVKSVSDLARVLMEAGLLDDLSKYETKRILGAINNVVGKQDVSQYVQKVMDIMVDNQLRIGANTLGRLLSIRGSRVDARGIEVQGELDPDGQRIAQVIRKSTSLPKDDIDNRIAEALNRMSSTDNAIADEATIEYAGLQIARQYVEDITESKAEEKELRDSIKQAKEDKDAGQMTEDAYKQYVEATNDAIRQNKIDRAEAFHSLVEQVGDVMSGSIERAKAWREAEKQRVEEIHHNANSDMEGRPTDEHHKDDRTQKIVNNSFARFLLAPLATFDQMLRMFGKKNTRGEGYLWNRYMRGWVEASEKEYTGYREALKVLDDKVSEAFAKARPGDKNTGRGIKSWGDLFALDRKLPRGTIRFWDGGEMKDHELTQGNLLYIYMADKMSDGRMKLRRMGITEEDVEEIKNFLDPRFIELADWMQDEFLVDKRNEYNEVHKRMFGASMAAIENYFPLKILANARLENVDVADPEAGTQLPATSTGSIIKRRRNNLALDVTGANAFSVILDHLQQMERWAAFAEFNRDLNTLLSYKRFRNQVMNMSSVYGAGKTLWNNFRNVCAMAAGAYRPPIAALDKSAVNIAKGVTAAKVSFRLFTALKQFLSMPAYLSDCNLVHLVRNLINPAGAWKWCMENLPLFEKRWKSRMAGDPRLLKTDMDWKMWRSRIVEIASRVGMSPNAFVDALTVAIGTHAMYQTKLAKYKRQGYDPDVAEERAKQDATIFFNQTQQSSEGAFLSTMQVDRSWLSVLFTVFRNSSMAYARQLYDAIRNIGHRLTPGYKGLSEEFMAKQMRRDGIDPDQADRNAKREYRRGIIRDLVMVGVFGYVVQFVYNLGAYLPYLILGDNEDEKDKMMDDVFNHSMFGSIEGLTGGDVMSAAGNMWLSGEGNPAYLTKDMPLASDVLTILKKMGKDQVSAMNDVINLCVQSGIGVNPQSLTDAVAAIIDCCGGNMESSRECALLIARIFNCPQSQLDKVYFDELGTSGDEASQMSVEEIAERYADYKMMREAPLTGWMRDQESSDSIHAQRKQRVYNVAKEKLDTRLKTESVKALLEEYKQVSDRQKELMKMRDSGDIDGYRDGMDQLRLEHNLLVHARVGRYKKDINELTTKWQKAPNASEAQELVNTMIECRDELFNDLSEIYEQQ